MKREIEEALQRIDPAALDYAEWLSVGMALKHEGFDWAVWDEWSRNDSRYHPGECRRKWESFRGSANPVTGATILKMAADRGWSSGGRELAWDAELGDGFDPAALTGPEGEKPGSPADELICYLRTLFRPDEYVNYVVRSFADEDGRWKPAGSGSCDRTAAQLIAELERCGGDIGAVTGDWKEPAGAWIRFNPVDGRGGRNENVTAFRYALVESDSMPLAEQEAAFRQMELPIACLVSSGGKSLHAIVHIGAESYEEYRERVEFLYARLAAAGILIDRQNSNPSRLSRMPGVTRNGRRQQLLATMIGKRSWTEWRQAMEAEKGPEDEDGEEDIWTEVRGNLPELPEEMIGGVLRRGHKMLISGSSKAGKSFLLMELCAALSEGKEWLGFPCRLSRVLYVNFEIDRASCLRRFEKIFSAMGIEPEHEGYLGIWNLRGKARPLDQMVEPLIRRIKKRNYEAVVVDPIYKVITGDENNASAMGAFCNQFDRICDETGASVIYCHHHSKGAQGLKRAMDRASGSGVFARDPDAQLDMIRLELTDSMKYLSRDGKATAWRMEGTLREFESFAPVNFWFEYPLHRVDRHAQLRGAYAEGSAGAAMQLNASLTAAERKRRKLDNAYDLLYMGEPVPLEEMARYLKVTEKTLRNQVKKREGEYWIESGCLYRYEPEEEEE